MTLAIVCKTQKEEKKVLEILEKEGKTWVSGSLPSTKTHFNEYPTSYTLYVYANNQIAYSNRQLRPNTTYTTAKLFIRQHEESNTIVIYQKDNETIALDKSTGKKAMAKCSPDDTYDFYTGAQLAFDRLIGSKGVKEVCRNAKVGEYIKITNPTVTFGWYKKGDILKVKKSHEYEVLCEKIGVRIRHDEYVVLEGYEPQEEPETFYNGKVVCVDNGGNKGIYTVGKVYEFKNGKLTGNNGKTYPDRRVHNFEEWQRFSGSKFVELVE